MPTEPEVMTGTDYDYSAAITAFDDARNLKPANPAQNTGFASESERGWSWVSRQIKSRNPARTPINASDVSSIPEFSLKRLQANAALQEDIHWLQDIPRN